MCAVLRGKGDPPERQVLGTYSADLISGEREANRSLQWVVSEERTEACSVLGNEASGCGEAGVAAW